MARLSALNQTSPGTRSQAKEKMPVLGTEHPTSRNLVVCSDEQRCASEQTARIRHTENVVTHDPTRNLLAFQEATDQPWSNHQQRPPIGQRQKAWVERRLRSFAENHPLHEAARRFEISGRKRLPARQNSNYGYHNHAGIHVKRCVHISHQKPD